MKKNKYAGQVKKRREAETLNALEKNMLAKVEQDRTLRQSLYHPIGVKAPDIPVDKLIAYLQENGSGDAKLYNRLHRGLIVYVKYWERVLVWNGHHWREDDWNEAHQAIENVCENYLKAADEKQREADSFSDEEKDLRKKVQGIADKGYRRVDRLRSKTGQDDLLVMTRRTRQPLLIMPDFIDMQYYSLPCPNGVVDLRTGELRDGRPEDYLLNACLTEYAPDMLELEDPCPETNAFLLRSMDGNQRLVDFIWRILGYGLIRDRREHVFIIFWGEHGRNGKDTLIKLVTHVLGMALSGDVQVEMFLQQQQAKSSSSPTPDVLTLRGMSIAWINEAEDGQKFALAKLKKLTGGGFITARGLDGQADDLVAPDAPPDHDHQRTAEGKGGRCRLLEPCPHRQMGVVLRGRSATAVGASGGQEPRREDSGRGQGGARPHGAGGDGVPTRRLEGSAGGQGLDEGPAGDMGRHRPVLYRVLPAGDTSEQPRQIRSASGMPKTKTNGTAFPPSRSRNS